MYCRMREAGRRVRRRMLDPMRQPQSIRFHLTAVFLLAFLLVVVLGSFTHLAPQQLQTGCRRTWPKCGCPIRAPSATSTTLPPISAPWGSNYLSTDPTELAETERQMAELSR